MNQGTGQITLPPSLHSLSATQTAGGRIKSTPSRLARDDERGDRQGTLPPLVVTTPTPALGGAQAALASLRHPYAHDEAPLTAPTVPGTNLPGSSMIPTRRTRLPRLPIEQPAGTPVHARGGSIRHERHFHGRGTPSGPLTSWAPAAGGRGRGGTASACPCARRSS